MKVRLAAAMLAACLFVVPVFAGPSYIGNSTFHSTGANVAPGAADLNYTVSYLCPLTTSTVLSCATGTISTDAPAYVVTNPPGPYWMPNSATSKWISVDSNASLGTGTDPNPGNYVFHTTFEFLGDPSADDPTLLFRWATDDSLIQVFLNGIFTGEQGVGTTSIPFPWHNATINGASLLAHGSSAAFQTGLNDLDFVVFNQRQATGNPMGLRVENPVPEPGSLLLLGSGLIGAAGFIRRKLGRG